MNIVVCVKWVISADNAIKAENGTLQDRGLYYVVNPHDLMAVEEAVRLNEQHPGGEVVLVCLGPPSAERGLRRCLAMGADKGMILWDTAFEGSDSYATALVLAAAIKNLSYDLVLCGQKAADLESGQLSRQILPLRMIKSQFTGSCRGEIGRLWKPACRRCLP